MVMAAADTRMTFGGTPQIIPAALSVYPELDLTQPDAVEELSIIVGELALALRFAIRALEDSTGLHRDEVVERLSARWRELGGAA